MKEYIYIYCRKDLNLFLNFEEKKPQNWSCKTHTKTQEEKQKHFHGVDHKGCITLEYIYIVETVARTRCGREKFTKLNSMPY